MPAKGQTITASSTRAPIGISMSGRRHVSGREEPARRGNLSRSAVATIFRACSVVYFLPDYRRPAIKVADYLALLERFKTFDWGLWAMPEAESEQSADAGVVQGSQ